MKVWQIGGHNREVKRHSPSGLVNATSVKVSVVIPNYNYARFLPQAVGSVLSQSAVDVEVIVVDDASSDDSVEVIARLTANDSRVRLVTHTTNMGPVDTFNDGLKLISGEYVVRLDADDLLTPGSLARSVALAEHFPNVGLVYGHPVHFIETDGNPKIRRQRGWAKPFVVARGTLPPIRSTPVSWFIWPGQDWLAGRCRTGLNVITSPEVLMRSSVVRRVGGQKQLAHTHDMEMWLRIAAYSDVGYIGGSDQAWHRDHDESLSSRSSNPMTDLEERHAAFHVLFDGVRDAVGDHDMLLHYADRALAIEAVKRASQAFDRGRIELDLMDDLEKFAIRVWPGVQGSCQWRSLTLRKKIYRSGLARYSPTRLGSIGRRGQLNWKVARWERWGI